MGLAFGTRNACEIIRAGWGSSMFRTVGTVLIDGIVVAGTAMFFAGIAFFRYGWGGMTDNGRSPVALLGFAGTYLFGAFVLATVWMFGRSLLAPAVSLERGWMQGYFIAITLLVAMAALVPPVWD